MSVDFISFHAMNSVGPWLILSTNGELWVSPELKPDEAAKRFLDQLAKTYPQWLEQLRANQLSGEGT